MNFRILDSQVMIDSVGMMKRLITVSGGSKTKTLVLIP